jgi:hypothetical protein
MAKWLRTDPSAVPEELARFVPSEWPGVDPLTQWREACLRWLQESPGSSLPFGQFGDSVDVIRECRRINMGWARDADR